MAMQNAVNVSDECSSHSSPAKSILGMEVWVLIEHSDYNSTIVDVFDSEIKAYNAYAYFKDRYGNKFDYSTESRYVV